MFDIRFTLSLFFDMDTYSKQYEALLVKTRKQMDIERDNETLRLEIDSINEMFEQCSAEDAKSLEEKNRQKIDKDGFYTFVFAIFKESYSSRILGEKFVFDEQDTCFNFGMYTFYKKLVSPPEDLKKFTLFYLKRFELTDAEELALFK